MNWEAAGAIGEMVGSAAVLVTLIYLAIQVRQNTRHVRAQMGHDGWLQNANDLTAMMGDDAAGAWVRVELDSDPPTPGDLRILDVRFRSILMHLGRVEHMTAQGLQVYSLEETAAAYTDFFDCRVGLAWLETHAELCDTIAPLTVARIRERLDAEGGSSDVRSFAAFLERMSAAGEQRGDT